MNRSYRYQALLGFFLVSLPFACRSYSINGKTFHSKESALEHQKNLMDEDLRKIEPRPRKGGKLALLVPADERLTRHPFVKGQADEEYMSYFLQFYLQDFAAIRKAIDKSNLFDSTAEIRAAGAITAAKEQGFDYLLVNNADATWTIFALKKDTDKVFRFPTGLPSLVDTLDDALLKLNAKPVASEAK